MEKNKGLFSVRKYPVGDFPDGKKGRKRKGGRLRQSMGFLLAAALLFNTLPASGLAASASGRGLCEHHTEHTAECGYTEAQPCTHEHTDDCYKTVESCIHEHRSSCYPEETLGEGETTPSNERDEQPTECSHSCSEESGCITKVLDCHHEHDESCGYTEVQECGYACEICNGTEPENTGDDTGNSKDAGTDRAECICKVLCTEDNGNNSCRINRDCPVCGAEDADLSRCVGKETVNSSEEDVEYDNVDADTAGCICKTSCTEDHINGDCPVCGVEDADLSCCKGEETKRTGEKVITAWEWIDPEEYLTDGMLALPGAGRGNPAFVEDVTALLPEKIQAEVAIVNVEEDREETEENTEALPQAEGMEIALTGWECAAYPEDGAYEGTYTFTASLPEGFVLTEDAAGLEVKVELGGAKMLAGTVSAAYQEASWNGSVTYTTKTADSCTSVTDSTEAVTWDAGWYVVNSTVTISQPITVNGDVNLILADGCTLNADSGIVVTAGNSLTIYAQSENGGTLNATGITDSDKNASAGIGGSTTDFASGSITIHGGVINATGGGQSGFVGAAGIGGGAAYYGNGGDSGAVIIFGGTITANSGAGGSTGAGIGGGGGGISSNGGSSSNITIYGGNVTAESHGTSSGGAGIGGGGGYRGSYSSITGGIGSNISITGGIVDAKGDAGNSSGYDGAPIGNGGNASGTESVSKDTAIVFENGAGTVCGTVILTEPYTVPDGYSLTFAEGGKFDGNYAFYKNGSPVKLETVNTVGVTGPATVKECGHEGSLQPNANGYQHGGACPYCGADAPLMDHTAPNGEGKCDDCGAEIVAVAVIGDYSYYYSDFTKTFTKLSGYTVTLLRNVEVTAALHEGGSTYDLNGYTVSGTEDIFWVDFKLRSTTFGDSKGSGKVVIAGSAGSCFTVASGSTLKITGGAYQGGAYAVTVQQGGILKLSGGTLEGKTGAINGTGTLADVLEDGYRVIGIPRDTALSELPKSITVEKCEHPGITVMDTGGTHGMDCPYCGYNYAHTTTLTATADATANTVTLTGGCNEAGCGYSQTLGTVTVTFPQAVYGDVEAVVRLTGIPAGYIFKFEVSGSSQKKTTLGVSEATIPLAQLFDSNDVTAGDHVFSVQFLNPDSSKQSPKCRLTLHIDPAPLTDNMVALDKTKVTYNGIAQQPGITVKNGGTTLTAGTDYDVSYTRDGVTTTDFTSAGTITVTITGVDNGNYAGTVKKKYTISKADVQASDLAYVTPDDLIYTGKTKTAGVTSDLTGLGELTVKYRKDNEGAFLTEAVEPGSYSVYAVISEGKNYNSAEIEMGQFTISYMDTPELQYNGSARKDYYSGDVAVTAVPADGHTYTVSDAAGGEYKQSFTISAQAGTVTKTLYFKDEAGHISDGVEVTVTFDLTPPTGSISVGERAWDRFLEVISFGHYAAKEYIVTIKAEDADGSGIDKIEYVVVEGSSQYTDISTLTSAVQESEWKEYTSGSKPTVPSSTSQYVVYARLTDKAGNVAYISTEGILLDGTPPTVDSLIVPVDTILDVTAGVTFTVSEAADYYYVILPKDSAAPAPEDIVLTCGGTLPEGKTGNAIAGVIDSGKGAVSGDTLPAGVSVTAQNLQPNTAYVVYVTAVDRAVDITNSATGTPAGNIAAVKKSAEFTTKKTLPVITEVPTVAGTYGQSVGEITITGGTAKDGDTVLTGTWTVSDTDKDRIPDAGTEEKVTVIFTPDNASYDSVSVQASLEVNSRSLDAPGVTVSKVAGSYTYTGSEIKPPVAVDTGTPASGIFISDSGAALTANDFTVSYSNNKDAGTASVTITGKGNYTGKVTRTFTIAKAPGRTIADLTGSYTDDGETYIYTITPVEGAVYRMGNDGKWQEENVFEGITPGTSVTFYAKMPEDKNYEDGTPKSITVDFPKLTPAAPALSYKADRSNPADVKVTITPVSGAEYSFDGGQTWTDENVKGGFTTSDTVTLAIRLKETDTHNQSSERTMSVNFAKEDREAPPAFTLSVEANGETDYTVTIPPTEGCEYSFDGITWSDNNVKTGVSVGETVTGYKRYKETDDHNASSAVSAKETMPKFTVKTPVISPAGGSYSGSISVTITCGSPDAEIYYTTDGSAPSRSSTRYTGAFTVSAPATVKAVAIKDGLEDSAATTVSYTKQGGGSGSGGNGGGGNENPGGNGDNGGSGGNGEGQGSGGNDSTKPGEGNTTPQPSVTPPADTSSNPGNGTAPVNPGSGNTSRPGTGTDPGSGNAGTPAQGTRQPFIKGEDGKIGWDVIRAEEEKAEEGSTINVDMNGSTVVPGDVFDSIKGRDITITFDMGGGIIWSVNGKSITTDKAGDIDFSVQTGVNTVPVDIVNNVTGERYSIQLSLAYEGEFGFTAVLSIGLGRENAGYTASLYYYNKSTGELEFICADEIAEDGTVSLAFTHASDYVIAIDGDEEEESGSVTETEQPEEQKKDSIESAEEIPQTGQAWRPWWLIVAGALVIIIGIGVFFVVKKKQEDENSGQ